VGPLAALPRLCLDTDADLHGGPADSVHAGGDDQQVADVDGFLEGQLVDRGGDGHPTGVA
jgi:hypothetical protein